MKTRPSTLSIIGFEDLPEGQLLTQFVDFNHGIGAAYERCIAYTKDFHTHDRLNLTFPRQSSIIRFLTKDPNKKFVVDDTRFLWMPEDVVHRQETESVIYDNLAIFPDRAVVDKAIKGFGERYGKTISAPVESVMAKRTPLLESLLNLYFLERIIEKRSAASLEGLTYQIFDEILRILFCPRKKELHEDDATFDGSQVSRAVKYIEANLFSEIDSAAIAKFSRVSIPTLFRKFKTETGMTPRDYILKRRMDEALILLKRGDHTVGDVALLIGYQDIAAFSKRFTLHFKKNPSSFIGES